MNEIIGEKISLELNFKIKISCDALKGIYLEMDNSVNISI